MSQLHWRHTRRPFVITLREGVLWECGGGDGEWVVRQGAFGSVRMSRRTKSVIRSSMSSWVSQEYYKPYLINVIEMEKLVESPLDATTRCAKCGQLQFIAVLRFSSATVPANRSNLAVTLVLYPGLFHVKCTEHARYRVSFSQIDSLFANTEETFHGRPSCTQAGRRICPHLPLPPAPIKTRRGMWACAATLYARHLSEVRMAVNECQSDAQWRHWVQETHVFQHHPSRFQRHPHSLCFLTRMHWKT